MNGDRDRELSQSSNHLSELICHCTLQSKTLVIEENKL